MQEGRNQDALKSNGAAFALECSNCSGGDYAALWKHHKNESFSRNRFKTLVGQQIRNARSLAMFTQPYRIYIERTDQQKNMARFYSLAIEKTLFDEICLRRRWGRIGTKGQELVHYFESEKEAVSLFLDLARRKRSRGYSPMTAEPAVRH